MPVPVNLADFNSFSPAQQSAWILSIPEYVNQREGTACDARLNILVKFERNTDGTIKPVSAKKLHIHGA